jgi:cbb3-type cytochrome c oxidase subunit III
MKKIASFFPLILLLCFGMFIGLTRRDHSKPNYAFFLEMTRSPAYSPQSTNPFFPDGKTQQLPVKGSIPRNFLPFPYENTEAERKRAGETLQNPIPLSFKALEKGKFIYQNFCAPCHGNEGKGDGKVAQRVPSLSMPINGKATLTLPEGELFHIVTYGRNHMPPHASQISQTDRWTLIHYLRDIQNQEKQRLEAEGLLYEEEEDPRRYTLVSESYGKEIYQINCSSCHGEDGRTPLAGVPTLNQLRVLASAPEDYYLDIITHGRKGTMMPSWESLLTATQIRSLVAYIASWKNEKPWELKNLTNHGDIQRGKALYQGNCMPCHGYQGKGGIGNTLNSPSFLALASPEFLNETIQVGRKHTAMPSGIAFNSQEINDMVAYLQSWKKPQSQWKEVQTLLQNLEIQKHDQKASEKIGKTLWRAHCESCHGSQGEGGIGACIQSQSFLATVDDSFLYRAIVEGRPGTAMPGWYFLDSRDVTDLIRFIRSWQNLPSQKLKKRPFQGRADFGEYLYKQACIQCHGEEGKGGVGGQIGNRVFLSSSSDEFLWNTIAYGKEGTAMRGFLKKGAAGGALVELGENDIDHLVAYLRKLESSPHSEPLKRPIESTSVSLGKSIYQQACIACHGDEGQGASGPAIGNPDFLKVADDGYLIGTIILGRENTEMLSFSRSGNVSLSSEEVQNVVAYLRSFEFIPLQKRRKVDTSSSNISEGKALYLNYCAGCHGSEGKGPSANQEIEGYAPSLNNQEFLKAAEDSFLLATIALGRPGTPMRAFAKGAGGLSDLTSNEIQKIVAFLRSWEEE